jgi:hypothetical protein
MLLYKFIYFRLLNFLQIEKKNKVFEYNNNATGAINRLLFSVLL